MAALPTAALAATFAWRAYQAETRLSLLPGGDGSAEPVALLIHRLALLFVVLATGLGAATLGVRVAAIDALHRLGRAVDIWRSGGNFSVEDGDAMPAELRDLAHSFEQATHALVRQEAELGEAIRQQELLTLEIHHRVKNNLQIIASLLNLQASRIRQPEARAEFQSARDRVRALATLHRHLYAPDQIGAIAMRPFLQELCGQLFHAMGEREGDRLCLEVDAADLRISTDQAVPLSLIVTEAVSNAVKYAFPRGQRGHIRVRLTAAEDTVTLCIEDDGVGLPARPMETEDGVRDGIGLQLIRGFVRQLSATLLIEQGYGTRYTIAIPLRAEAGGR